MKFSVSPEIFEKYPKTMIGYVVANILVKDIDPYTEQMKNSLSNELLNIGITAKNYVLHPNIEGWKKIFKGFGVNKGHRSSVEALVKRTTAGDKMWTISNVVDLYNCCSVLSLIPMGGYDLSKVEGDICVRFGKETDKFDALGIKDKVEISRSHVVYADNEKVMCWLWNYRDSKITSVTKETKKAVFFFDSAFDLKHIPMEKAIQIFESKLSKIGAVVLSDGILNIAQPEVELDIKELTEKCVQELDYSQLDSSSFSATQERDGIKLEKKIFRDKAPSIKPLVKPAIIQKQPVNSGPLVFARPISETASDLQVINAAATGNLDYLIRAIDYNPDLAKSLDWYSNTLLIHAACGNHPTVIEFLLNSDLGIDINHQNNNGETALIVGVKSGYKESVFLLLKLNADPKLCNKDGETALSIAKSKKYEDIAEEISINIARFSNKTRFSG